MMDQTAEWLKRENRDWEKVYSERSLTEIPWHSDKPDREFTELIESEKIHHQYVLDVGCGAGTDAIYLASRGNNVTAIDISREAIKIAVERAERAGVKVNFISGDFLEVKFNDASFDFINDRGCFHHMNPLRREDFVAKVREVLKSRGLYYLRCWSDKQKREGGAYSISKETIYHIFSKTFDVGEIREFRFSGKGAWGYACLMRKRV